MEKEEKERKKVVVEEITEPVGEEMVSSHEMKTDTDKEETSESSPEEKTEGETSQEKEKEKEPEVTENPSPDEKVKKGGMLWVLIPVILLLGALLGGMFVYFKGISRQPSPTPAPETFIEEPTSEPEAQEPLDLTKYSIIVRNGSGIAGEATRARTFLEEAGFVVASTGNASSYDYQETEVLARGDVDQAFLDELISELSKSYQVVLGDDLEDDADEEIIVIVGQLKAE